MRKESATLEEMTAEYASVQESIQKVTDEINLKRRSITELKSKLKELESKINAKKYELLSNSISDKTGMNMDKFISELEKGNVLVDSEQETPKNNVSQGHTEKGDENGKIPIE